MRPAIHITRVRFDAVELPLEKPLVTAIHEVHHVACLLVTVETDAGVSGEGYSFCFDTAKLRAIAQFAKSISSRYIGRDPHDVEALWAETFQACNFYGQDGVAIIALTPLDIACWDINAKTAGKPLHHLFGAYRDRVPVYATGGLWLSSNLDELQSEARQYVAENFKAMKLRVGSKRWQDDVARVEAVLEAIGSKATLMVDANQGLTPDHASRLGRELDRHGLAWYEEPLPTWRHAEMAELASLLDTPIATGETEYTRYGIRNMIDSKCADILMPDLQRMGGYTEFRKVMGLCAAYDMPVSPHIFTEHSLALVASAPTATYVEHTPWFIPLFREQVVIELDGMITLPQRPGIGFTFDWDALERYRVPLACDPGEG